MFMFGFILGVLLNQLLIILFLIYINKKYSIYEKLTNIQSTLGKIPFLK